MQALDVVDIKEWCENNGDIQVSYEWKIQVNSSLIFGDSLRYPLDADGDLLWEPVRDACIEVMGSWDECLLWVTQTGVHAYLENWPAFYALRGKDNERNSLWEKPGHLFLWEERERLCAYLDNVLNNFWDALILPATYGQPEALRLRTSHDDYVALWSSTPRQFSLI